MEEKTVHLKLFGKGFVCRACGADAFWRRRMEVTAPGSSFLKAKDTAVVLVCSKCGYLHWFMPELGAYNAHAESDA